MINTHGLSHAALRVSDPERALAFYVALFGVREYFRDEHTIQVLGPGEYDVLAFERSDTPALRGSIDHIGFRLVHPDDMAGARRTALAAGARIVSEGEFSPGYPFLNILDPDGNQIEIWYE